MEKTALETILEVLAVFLIGVLFVLGQMFLSSFLRERSLEESVLGEHEKETEFVYLIEDQDKYVDIVDEATDVSVLEPQVVFETNEFSFDPQTTEGILGTPTESVRMYNPSSDTIFDVTLAPLLAGSGGGGFDNFNEVVWRNNAVDPADQESFPIQSEDVEEGSLNVNPMSGGITTDVVGCSLDPSDISKGSAFSYLHKPLEPGEDVESITLVLANGAVKYCRWDIQGVVMQQWVPARQASDGYSLDMLITIL